MLDGLRLQWQDGGVLTAASEQARKAGRGLVAIAGAKIYFILAGYAVQLILPRVLGSPESFGLYSKVMSGVSIVNNVLIAATIQSVSKFISASEAHESQVGTDQVLRQALRLQLLIGGLLTLMLVGLSPSIGAFHKDDGVTPLFQVASVVVFCYALYAAVVGSLNGRQKFGHQAGLDITFSTLRTVGILGGGAIAGLGALGAVSGFAAAAAVITTIALIAAGIGKKGSALPVRDWLAFMGPIYLYQGLLNGVLQLDVQVLGKTVTELALLAGVAGAAASDLANQQVGFYRGAQTFAFVPYQLLLSMTFIVFPVVSRATSSGDEEAARRTIEGATRFSLLALLAVSAPIAGAADGVLRIAYPEEYLVGAPALGILVFGVSSFALFVICGTILSSAGRPGLSAGIAAIGLLVVVVADSVLIRQAGTGTESLSATAIGTSLGMFVAFLLAGGAVLFRFKTLFAPMTVLRCALAGVVAYFVASFVPHDTRLLALAALAAGFASYLIALVLLGEIRRTDLQLIRGLVKR